MGVEIQSCDDLGREEVGEYVVDVVDGGGEGVAWGEAVGGADD